MRETYVRAGKLWKCHQECHWQQETTIPLWISLLRSKVYHFILTGIAVFWYVFTIVSFLSFTVALLKCHSFQVYHISDVSADNLPSLVPETPVAKIQKLSEHSKTFVPTSTFHSFFIHTLLHLYPSLPASPLIQWKHYFSYTLKLNPLTGFWILSPHSYSHLHFQLLVHLSHQYVKSKNKRKISINLSTPWRSNFFKGLLPTLVIFCGSQSITTPSGIHVLV